MGFEKIDLKSTQMEETKDNSNISMKVEKTRRFKFNYRLNTRRKKIWATAGVIAVLILIFGILIPLATTYASLKRTEAQAKVAFDALKRQDIDQATVELKKTRTSLQDTQKNLHFLFLLRLIPVVNGYYSDADHMIKAGFHGLDAADLTLDSIKPYADVLGLKGQGSFVGGSAQQRIETAVATMDKITPRIDDIAKDLTLAKEDIDYIDPGRYPAFLVGPKLSSQISDFKKLADDGATFVNNSKPLIKILPSLLGQPDEKKYLVLFQNDKELRPTGGFITAYSIFRVDKGVIHVDNSSDIYELDATVPNKPVAPAPILKYLPNVPRLNLRDTNLSPDFAKSMEKFVSMYKTAGGYKKTDGIIAVDTQALVAAMNVLGDITVNGQTFTTKTDPRCDCPQVIYELEAYADQPVEYQRTNRKGLIGDLMYEIMNKAFSSSPKLYWGPLFQAMITEVGEKHILFNLYNKDAQQGVEALNAGGRIVPFDGDYLHINEANFGGAKSNLFVDEAVDQKYEVGSDGTITKTVTIDYKNPHAPSDCNLEHGNLCLNAELRDWIRVYVPKGAELIDSSGSTVKVSSYEDLGKTVFEGFVKVRPMGVAKYTLTYKLPFRLEKGSPLPLLIQKQPGASDNDYSITKNGKTLNQFSLIGDKTLKLNL